MGRLIYFDTHCHLSLFKDIPSVIATAKSNSVKHILAVSMYYRDNLSVLELAQKYPEVVPALGIHPIQASDLLNSEEKLSEIRNLILNNRVQTIGEVGLDRYFVKKEQAWKQQESILRFFLDFAEKNKLCVNLHGKYAERELIGILSEYTIRKVVIHWFAGSPDLVKKGVNRGYYFSITPEVIYGKRMQRLVELVPVKQLLSESDGPVKYKGPSPFIGEPALMKKVIEEITKIKKQDVKEIQHILYKTAKEIFLNT